MLEEFGTGPFVWAGGPDDVAMVIILVSIYFICRREKRDEDERILEELREWERVHGIQ